MVQVDVIVPAGGTINESFARVVGTNNKALIKLEGRSVIRNTLECLRGLNWVRRIVVIGSEAVKIEAAGLADEVLKEGTTGPENIFNGLRWLTNEFSPSERVMIVTSDLPFLTGDILRSFLEKCPLDKDFCVPLISKDSFDETFPGATATFVTMQDGTWTTGCAYLATAKGLFTAMPHIEKVFELRKSKLGMARMLGPRFVYGYLTKKLTVRDVEDKVRDLLKCSGVAVPNSPPELSYDIDYIEDYHYALQTVKLRQVKV